MLFIYCTLNAVCCLITLRHAMLYVVQSSASSTYHTRSTLVLYLEAVSSHALLVLSYEVGAFLLGIVRGGEQHAFVAFCFLFGTDAARLDLGCASVRVPYLSFVESVVLFEVRRWCLSSLRPCWRRLAVLEGVGVSCLGHSSVCKYGTTHLMTLCSGGVVEVVRY